MDAAIARALEDARFIGGTQVAELEKQLAAFVGVRHCVTCANGTDAITLALKAWNVGEGDAVFVPDFTFFASGECPAGEGATCIFVDVKPETFNMDAAKLEEAVLKVRAQKNLMPKAVISVDLFGQTADYREIKDVCKSIICCCSEDGAQGFGGSLNGRMACSFGDISTTSFFPAKPLGCYGDGGAVFTNNDEWAAMIRSLSVHGKSGEDKYNNVRLGMNSRLDTIQAAILQVKLEAFQNYEVKNANQVAQWYHKALEDTQLILPIVPHGMISSWAQYTVRLPVTMNRVAVQAKMKEAGVPSMVYYFKPMHLQGAFAGTRSAQADCPVSEEICGTVLSLPMGPYLDKKMC